MAEGKHRNGGLASLRQVGMSIAGVLIGFLVVGALVLLGVQVLGGGHGGTAAVSSPPAKTSPSAASSPVRSAAVIPVPQVPASVRARLPLATTDGTVAKAPTDLSTASGGQAVQIPRAMPAFASPGAHPIAMIPGTEIGATTWLPVIGDRSGWLRVRLPSRPNGATAWVPAAGLMRAHTDWAVTVRLDKGTLTVTRGGRSRGTWTIGQGEVSTPTPVGQTFLLSGFVDPTQTFSPVIYALGTHSQTLDSFGGGPGTVAVHGWPTAAGRHGRVSHGCVRVPSAALKIFADLPTGTPVDIVG